VRQPVGWRLAHRDGLRTSLRQRITLPTAGGGSTATHSVISGSWVYTRSQRSRSCVALPRRQSVASSRRSSGRVKLRPCFAIRRAVGYSPCRPQRVQWTSRRLRVSSPRVAEVRFIGALVGIAAPARVSLPELNGANRLAPSTGCTPFSADLPLSAGL